MQRSQDGDFMKMRLWKMLRDLDLYTRDLETSPVCGMTTRCSCWYFVGVSDFLFSHHTHQHTVSDVSLVVCFY